MTNGATTSDGVRSGVNLGIDDGCWQPSRRRRAQAGQALITMGISSVDRQSCGITLDERAMVQYHRDQAEHDIAEA